MFFSCGVLCQLRMLHLYVQGACGGQSQPWVSFESLPMSFRLGWRATELQGSSYLCCPITGTTDTCHCVQLVMCLLGKQTEVLWFAWQACKQLNHLLPKCSFPSAASALCRLFMSYEGCELQLCVADTWSTSHLFSLLMCRVLSEYLFSVFLDI